MGRRFHEGKQYILFGQDSLLKTIGHWDVTTSFPISGLVGCQIQDARGKCATHCVTVSPTSIKAYVQKCKTQYL